MNNLAKHGISLNFFMDFQQAQNPKTTSNSFHSTLDVSLELIVSQVARGVHMYIQDVTTSELLIASG